jgi:hypothetical protein
MSRFGHLSPLTQPKNPELAFETDIAHFTPRQMDAVAAIDSGKYKFILFGGALGGGKSFSLRWIAVRFLLSVFAKYQKKYCQVMLACEDYTSLKDRQMSKVAREFPEWLGQPYQDHRDYGRCFILNPEYGSGVICFRNLDDASKYASAEFCAIFVDELTKNNLDTFNFLRTRLRWPGIPDDECLFMAGTNPGGVGHGWVKALWMDKVFPEEFTTPIDYRSKFHYIPSRADDNPYIDPSYWSILSTLPDGLRKAFRDGDWDTFVGQAFPDFGSKHIIPPRTIPSHAKKYMTFDWGYGAPFSILWWWVDADGRIYACNEWYGWSGSPNQGIRLTDREIAQGIIDREEKMGVRTSEIIRLAGPDCFSKKPDYRGGGQGPSTAEVFASFGINLSPGDPSRDLKIRQFRERLRILPDAAPMMQVYDTCKQFIRCIPLIQVDQNNPEYVDDDGEIHVFDSACHICMARPIVITPLPKLSPVARRLDDLIAPKSDSYEREALMDMERSLQHLENYFGLPRHRDGFYYNDLA